MSTNERRHDIDLTIRDKDLVTGRDCRRLISQALAIRDATRRTAIRRLPWWRRAIVRLVSVEPPEGA